VNVVAAHLYRNGKNVKAVSLDEPIDCNGKSEFVWIGLFEPSERELEQLEKNYGLHPLAFEDALKANQMPKVDVYGDQLFVMTRTAHLEHDHIAYGETAIFVGKNFIISVRHGSARAHSDLRAQLEAAPSLLGQGPDISCDQQRNEHHGSTQAGGDQGEECKAWAVFWHFKLLTDNSAQGQRLPSRVRQAIRQ
jgi:magnesium transporter